MEQLESLKKFKLFNKLNDQDLEKFASRLTEETFADGEIICQRGKPGDSLYLIKQGSVEITLPLYRYEEKSHIVSDLDKGMFFGELTFWDNKECSADVHAKGEVKLLKLKKSDYDDIITSDPECGYKIQHKIILTLSNMIRSTDDKYSHNVHMGRYE